ncbi:hypothetical protein HDU76_005012, partial [Blyttiomyces sp. JEL0837]
KILLSKENREIDHQQCRDKNIFYVHILSSQQDHDPTNQYHQWCAGDKILDPTLATTTTSTPPVPPAITQVRRPYRRAASCLTSYNNPSTTTTITSTNQTSNSISSYGNYGGNGSYGNIAGKRKDGKQTRLDHVAMALESAVGLLLAPNRGKAAGRRNKTATTTSTINNINTGSDNSGRLRESLRRRGKAGAAVVAAAVAAAAARKVKIDGNRSPGNASVSTETVGSNGTGLESVFDEEEENESDDEEEEDEDEDEDDDEEDEYSPRGVRIGGSRGGGRGSQQSLSSSGMSMKGRNSITGSARSPMKKGGSGGGGGASMVRTASFDETRSLKRCRSNSQGDFVNLKMEDSSIATNSKTQNSRMITASESVTPPRRTQRKITQKRFADDEFDIDTRGLQRVSSSSQETACSSNNSGNGNQDSLGNNKRRRSSQMGVHSSPITPVTPSTARSKKITVSPTRSRFGPGSGSGQLRGSGTGYEDNSHRSSNNGGGIGFGMGPQSSPPSSEYGDSIGNSQTPPRHLRRTRSSVKEASRVETLKRGGGGGNGSGSGSGGSAVGSPARGNHGGALLRNNGSSPSRITGSVEQGNAYGKYGSSSGKRNGNGSLGGRQTQTGRFPLPPMSDIDDNDDFYSTGSSSDEDDDGQENEEGDDTAIGIMSRIARSIQLSPSRPTSSSSPSKAIAFSQSYLHQQYRYHQHRQQQQHPTIKVDAKLAHAAPESILRDELFYSFLGTAHKREGDGKGFWAATKIDDLRKMLKEIEEQQAEYQRAEEAAKVRSDIAVAVSAASAIEDGVPAVTISMAAEGEDSVNVNNGMLGMVNLHPDDVEMGHGARISSISSSRTLSSCSLQLRAAQITAARRIEWSSESEEEDDVVGNVGDHEPSEEVVEGLLPFHRLTWGGVPASSMTATASTTIARQIDSADVGSALNETPKAWSAVESCRKLLNLCRQVK